MLALFSLPLDEPEFKLDPTFIAKYVGCQPKWGPVGYFVYKRTYARPLPDGSTEEFWQTAQRVVEGCYQIQQRHCRFVHTPWDALKAQRSAQDMFERMWAFKWLPPGRGLWMMGTDFVKTRGSAALQNCGFISTARIDEDFARPFTWLMDMSMLGVGVGSDTRGAGSVYIKKAERSSSVHQIPDSREGWVYALKLVLRAYANDRTSTTDLDGHVVASKVPTFDYSLIRPAGSPIKGFGGTSAGYKDLQQLLEVHIPSVLDPLAGQPITETAIVDLHNFIGKCVVAGNVRRSAEIMLGDPRSQEFLDLKNPEVAGEALTTRRWVSNNTVFADVGMVYDDVARRTAQNGEPGYFWLENARRFGRTMDPPTDVDANVAGVNPCGEQSLWDGELCNVFENFPANHDSYEDFQATLSAGYLYGKTVSLVPTHCAETNAIIIQNRRIGASLSGVVSAIERHGYRKFFQWCDQGYRWLRRRDSIYSNWLGVHPSIKLTSIKPSGTVSKLVGEFKEGAHRSISEYFLTRIRTSADSVLLPAIRAAGYSVMPDVTAPDNRVVIEFPCHDKDFRRGEEDCSIWEQLSLVAALQHFWADNQVSYTVKYHAEDPLIAADVMQIEHTLKAFDAMIADASPCDEASLVLDRARVARSLASLNADQTDFKSRVGLELQTSLEAFESQLKGISFLPHAHGYAQPPKEAITLEDYTRRVATLKPLIFGPRAPTHEAEDRGCDGEVCTF